VSASHAASPHPVAGDARWRVGWPELLVAGISFMAFLAWRLSQEPELSEAAFLASFAAVLVLLATIDGRRGVIPNRLVYPALVIDSLCRRSARRSSRPMRFSGCSPVRRRYWRSALPRRALSAGAT
jgi:hypothetical protein